MKEENLVIGKKYYKVYDIATALIIGGNLPKPKTLVKIERDNGFTTVTLDDGTVLSWAMFDHWIEDDSIKILAELEKAIAKNNERIAYNHEKLIEYFIKGQYVTLK